MPLSGVMHWIFVMFGMIALCKSLPTNRPAVTALRMASSQKMVSKHVLVAIADGIFTPNT